MYCKNCGSEVTNGSKFCNQCGSPVEIAVTPKATENKIHMQTAKIPEEKPPIRKPVFDEFQWNVSDYPNRDVVEKTEDVNFNWNADPASIPETPRRQVNRVEATKSIPVENVMTGENLEKELFKPVEPIAKPEEMSASERIDKFYTFNKKNEEFQKLINNEYQRVKSGNVIGQELSQADKLAAERFETRKESSSMEEFLEQEGIVKPYQPKAFQSDVLQRIEAQEAAREAARLEEEARLAAIEEARLAAEAQKRAEEEAKRKAAEEAAKLEEIARKKAAEEARAAEAARIRAAEEARQRAEAEARMRAEEEARQKAEAEAKVRAAEEARIKAEADLKAAQEAARIRAQQEARLAAEAERQFKEEQERKRLEAEEAQKALEAQRLRIAREANQAAAQEEARKVLEQTSRLREEEAAKIRAAAADLRTGNFNEPNQIPVNKEVEEAHQATRNQISEMAKARDEFFAFMDSEEPGNENPVTGRATMMSSDDITHTRVIKKEDIVSGLNEPTRVAYAKPAPAPVDDDEFFNSLDEAAMNAQPAQTEAQPIDFREPVSPAQDLEDLLGQFEENKFEENKTENYGLNDTVLMPQNEAIESYPENSFDNYGNDIAYGNAQNNEFNDFYGGNNGFYDDDEEELSKKELRQRAKEEKRLERERAKAEKKAKKNANKDFSDDFDFDEKEEGQGKGKIVLKVILVILIVILAIEIVGMGIRFLAPQSKAAEMIDGQLNKFIQLITGDDTEYTVLSAQVRTEPMEDKTDLINAQIGKNKNGNIEKIVYSSDLAYNQDTDSQISDLVLSQPITEVEWGRDKDNYPVYFDEQVIGQIIAFESNKVELMNNGDEKVLKMINPDMNLYTETALLKDSKLGGTFSKLEIGEIRQGGSNYYVWVRETIGDNTTRKVYSMYPEKKFVMKMASCYVV